MATADELGSPATAVSPVPEPLSSLLEEPPKHPEMATDRITVAGNVDHFFEGLLIFIVPIFVRFRNSVDIMAQNHSSALLRNPVCRCNSFLDQWILIPLSL